MRLQPLFRTFSKSSISIWCTPRGTNSSFSKTYLLRDPPENFYLFRGYDVFCILATGGNLWPPWGHYLCHCSMVDDDTSRNYYRKTRQSQWKSGWDTSTMHFGMPMEISPTDSWLSEEHQVIHIRSDRKKNCMQFFIICFVVLALFAQYLNFILFVLRELETWTWTWTRLRNGNGHYWEIYIQSVQPTKVGGATEKYTIILQNAFLLACTVCSLHKTH